MLAELLFHLTGFSLFEARLFRAGASAIFSAGFIFLLMPVLIRFLKKIDATSDFQKGAQQAPPILGGLLIVFIVIISTLCFADMNAYGISILLIMAAYSAIGGVDDILKIRNKRAVAAGLISRHDYQDKADGLSSRIRLVLYFLFSLVVAIFAYKLIPGMTGHLTIPFVKPSIWYPHLPNWAFIILICFVITSTANGANFTDGLDTLVSVPIITTSAFVGMVAYVSGNAVFSEYFLIPHLPGVDELFPICTAIIGAMLAYLWFNCPPADIYMGDGGSIGLGGAIGMMFVLIKAPLFLPVVGVIFLCEAMSVVLQISGFKLTRRFSSDQRGRRIFLRAPLHDHFRLKLVKRYSSPQLVNSKVIWRFHLVSILGLILGTLIYFKVR